MMVSPVAKKPGSAPSFQPNPNPAALFPHHNHFDLHFPIEDHDKRPSTFSLASSLHNTANMLIPRSERKKIHEYLFREGVLVAKKDFECQHADLEMKNLWVCRP